MNEKNEFLWCFNQLIEILNLEIDPWLLSLRLKKKMSLIDIESFLHLCNIDYSIDCFPKKFPCIAVNENGSCIIYEKIDDRKIKVKYETDKSYRILEYEELKNSLFISFYGIVSKKKMNKIITDTFKINILSITLIILFRAFIVALVFSISFIIVYFVDFIVPYKQSGELIFILSIILGITCLIGFFININNNIMSKIVNSIQNNILKQIDISMKNYIHYFKVFKYYIYYLTSLFLIIFSGGAVFYFNKTLFYYLFLMLIMHLLFCFFIFFTYPRRIYNIILFENNINHFNIKNKMELSKFRVLYSCLFSLMSFIYILGYIYILFVLFFNDSFSLGKLLMFVIQGWIFMFPFLIINNHIFDMIESKIILESTILPQILLNDILKKEFIIPHISYIGDVELIIKNLNYNFFDKNIFKKVNLKFSNNTISLIAGKRGTGKTFLCKIIMGKVDVPSNTIFLNNKDINFFSSEDIDDVICYMSSKVLINQDTFWENITNGKNYNLQDVETLCKNIGLYDTIEKMSLKFSMHINNAILDILSETDILLIGIARIILQNKKIIVIDGVLSKLDSDIIQKVLMTLKSLNNTVLIFDNKMLFSKYIDKKLIIQNQEIIEKEVDYEN